MGPLSLTKVARATGLLEINDAGASGGVEPSVVVVNVLLDANWIVPVNALVELVDGQLDSPVVRLAVSVPASVLVGSLDAVTRSNTVGPEAATHAATFAGVAQFDVVEVDHVVGLFAQLMGPLSLTKVARATVDFGHMPCGRF